MVYMKFLSLALGLVDAAKDGELTLNEISDCVTDTFPDYSHPVLVEVRKATEDGSVSVWEVFKIITAIVS